MQALKIMASHTSKGLNHLAKLHAEGMARGFGFATGVCLFVGLVQWLSK